MGSLWNLDANFRVSARHGWLHDSRVESKMRGYGWRPDLPDHRDHKLSLARVDLLPSKVDLSPLCPPVYDQGSLGSCTANAIAAAYEFDLLRQKKRLFTPSRLFIYYNERAIEGTIREDAGAELRDGIKTLVNLGTCTESTWPYVISKFARKPTKAAYTQGLRHQAVSYQRLDNTQIGQLKSCLASGFPIMFGFTVYESFESQDVANTGVVAYPQPSEGVVGGHAVLLVGYDDATQTFKVRNSWSASWGLKGYFTLPYSYVTNPNLADDFWVLRGVEG